MKIKYKACLILMLVIVILTTISAYINYKNEKSLIQRGMQNEFQIVTNLINNLIQTEGDTAASMASLLVNLPKIKEIMRAHDRDLLIKYVVPPLLIQHEKFDVEQVHFHYPPATSFLRVTNLKKWGDDLSSTREMVLKANKNHFPLKGIEVSSTGMNIRAVDLIKDDQGPIGSLEVERNFTGLLDDVKQVTRFNTAAFVDENLMERIATLVPKPDPERIIGGYRNVYSTDWDFIKPLVTPSLLKKVNDATTRVVTLNEKYIGIVIIPLLDFKGTQIGYVLAAHHFDRYQTALNASLVKTIAFGLLQALLLFGTLLVVLNTYYNLPLKSIDENFEKVFNGNTEFDAGPLTARKDEIGSLAKYIEKAKELVKKSKDQTAQAPQEKDQTLPRKEGEAL